MAMNHFTYIEIPTTDLKKAQRFYGAIFGWRFHPSTGNDKRLVLETGGALNGFLVQVSRVPKNPGILVFVEVADIDGLLKKVRRVRGKVLQGKREIPDRGWTAIIASPDECTFGLWQPHWFQAA
jgi:predicted enzyme related to lactoylglutathione lyase